MTALYDSNFSVRLVERMRETSHHDDGEVVCCAECQTAVVMVCPNGHQAPIAYLAKTNGTHLKPAKIRQCACGRPIEVSRARHCEICRSKHRQAPPDRDGFCKTRGCDEPIVEYSGRGRPPTRCEKHWVPVSKRKAHA